MNKRNWISALLAVMMVISMMACIVVPVAAEEYTLPNDAVNVSTVAAVESGAQNYKMESIEDLVYVMNHHSYFDVDDTIYLANDIDTEDYEGGSAAFKTAYEAATCTGTADFYPSIDGLGHTIYNYNANRSVFGNHMARNNGFIKNISFDNAKVTTSGHQGFVVFRPELKEKNAGHTNTMENIHVKNSVISSSDSSGASVFGHINTGNNKNIVIRNCSVINTAVTSTCQYAVGILVGRGRTGGNLTIENILIAGCTLNNSGKASHSNSEGGGLVVGDIIMTTTGKTATLRNIGVFNNTAVLTHADYPTIAKSGAALLTNVCGPGSGKSSDILVDKIYAAGNKVKEYDGTIKAYDRLLTSGKYNGANLVGYSNIKTDGVANILVKGRDSSVITSADSSTMDANYTMWKTGLGDAGWGIDTTGNFTLLEDGEKAPVKVTFTADGNTATYYTDLNGNVRVTVDEKGLPVLADAADITALGTSDWKATDGSAVNAGTDWTKVVVDEDTAYTKVSLPPIAIKLDKETYSKGDIVTATVSLVGGANLAAVEVGFDFDADVLTAVEGGITAENGWYAVKKENSSNMAAVSAVAGDGQSVTEAIDIFTIKFRVTQDIASTATDLALTAKLEYACSIDDNGATEKTEAELAAYTDIVATADIYNPEIQDSYYDELTPAGAATATDDVTAYKISNVDELIAASNNAAAFTTDDVIYITNDLDITAWAAENADKTFGTEFTNFNTTITFTMDGLGHTITGYTDNIAFFGSKFNGTLRHVTFKDSTVTRSSGTKSGGCSLLAMQTTAAVEYDDVHLINCHVDFTYTHESNQDGFSGLFVGRVLSGATALTIRSCTVTDSTVHVARAEGNTKGLTDIGILAGRVYPATVTVENVIVKGSGVQFPIDTPAHADGMLIGQIYDGNTKNIYFNNIGVFDCTFDVDTFSNDYPFAIIANLRSAASGALKTFDNIYVYGNTYSYLTGEGDAATRTTLPMDTVVHVRSGETQAKRNPSNIKTDADVVYALNHAANTAEDGKLPGANESKSAKVADSNKIFTGAETDYATAIGLLNESASFDHWNYVDDDTVEHWGNKVTFTELGVSKDYYTSRLNEHVLYEETETGLVAVDPALFTKLTNNYWYNAEISKPTNEDFIEKGYAWVDETYPEDAEYIRVPYASEATRNDGISVYAISSVAELIKANMALALRGYAPDGTQGIANGSKEDGLTKSGDARFVVWNYETSDTIYITEDLDMADWDTTEIASYDGVYTPYYLPYYYTKTTGGSLRATVEYRLNDGTVDFDNDGTADAIKTFATKQELFAAEYCGFAAGYSAGMGYVILQADVDGLNHTIKNFVDDQPFIMNMNGTLSNLVFEDASVSNTCWDGVNATANAIVVGSTNSKDKTLGVMDGVVIDNVHLNNATLTANVSTNAALFVAGVAHAGTRNVAIKNSSAVGSKVISNLTQDTSQSVGLATGYIRYGLTLENCIFEDCTIVNTKELHHETGMIIGDNVGSDKNSVYYQNDKEATYKNLAVVNCKYEGPLADPAWVSVIHAAKDYPDDRGVILENIFVSGNTVKNTSDAEAEAVPVTDILSFHNTANDLNVAPSYNNIITDSGVTHIMNDYLTEDNDILVTNNNLEAGVAAAVKEMNAAAATADWYLDNGNYVPAYAMVGTTGYRMNVGHTDIADVINNATSGETVKVCLDQEASTVAIPAGVTVELNGAVLDAIVGGEGYVNDDTDGLGGVTGLGTIGAANAQLPLNDKTNGVYRLYNFDIVVGTDGAIDGYKNARKFRLKLNFNNKDAYALLAAGTSGMTLQALLSGEALEEDVPHTFLSVADYATKVAANDGKSYSLVLRVYGMEAVANTDLNITYNVTSAGVAKAAATSYAVPAEEA